MSFSWSSSYALLRSSIAPLNHRTDRSAAIPFDDFDINAAGTMNLLEAARRFSPDAPFIYLSTNKVYGDRPNTVVLVESELR